jgi:hypothetical protein
MPVIEVDDLTFRYPKTAAPAVDVLLRVVTQRLR